MPCMTGAKQGCNYCCLECKACPVWSMEDHDWRCSKGLGRELTTVRVMVHGVFASMEDKRKFEVHLANCQSWTSCQNGIPEDGEGWVAAGRMVIYCGQDTAKVAGFRRALLHWGASPETVKLAIPSGNGDKRRTS